MSNVAIFGVEIPARVFIAILLIGSVAVTSLSVANPSNVSRVGIVAFGGMWFTAGWLIGVITNYGQ